MLVLEGNVQVRLRALDLNDVTLQEAIVGIPFKVEIALEGALSEIQDQKIDHIDDFVITGRQTHLMNINNVRTTKSTFIIQTQKVGTYTIGPAHVVVSGVEYHSDSIIVKVGTQAQSKPAASTQQQGTDVFMRLACDKKSAFVGEKVMCTIRVYCAQEQTQIQAITEPACEGLSLKTRNGPEITQEKIKGHEYTCAQWEWEMYPTKSGSLVVPALCGDFNIPLDMNAQGFNVYNFFIGPMVKPKRVYSNPVTLDVMPLPHNQKKAQAVGSFNRYSACLKQSKAQEGEGVVLTLTLEGTGDLSQVEAPVLMDMPDGLKWYESKHTSMPQDHGRQRKSFEYIIQGLYQGVWTLPAQQFFYFDPSYKKYMTLQTEPERLTITSRAQQATHTQTQIPTTTLAKTSQDTNSEDALAPLEENFEFSGMPWKLPWWLMGFIMGIPCVYVVSRAGYRRIKSMNKLTAQNKKTAYVNAKRLLLAATKRNDVHMVHGLFIEFFAQRIGCMQTEISPARIEAYLDKIGFSQEQIHAWHAFFEYCASLVYGNQQYAQIDKHVFEQAHYWLSQVQEKA
jgi:hypothetical protein